jgi:hypothetical protein
MMTSKQYRLFVTALLFSFVIAAAPAYAGTISVAWDPVASSDLAGYRLYYGTTAGQYTQTLDVGMVTDTVLTGLADCTTYYIAVKAVGNNGLESVNYSNVISGWARPEVDSANPTQVMRSSQTQLVISGANFQAGAAVALSNGGVSVDAVSVNDCHQLAVDITVSDSAAVGPVNVTVVNPDQVYGEAAGLFAVASDTVGPVISAVQASGVGSTSATITWTTDEPSDSQVFFREAGESDYQQTAVDETDVTSHTVILTGLTPETEYEYYVRSADASGNESTADGGSSFTTQQNGFTYLRFEAESVTVTPPLEGGSGVGAFGGAWIALQDGAPHGNPNNPAGTWDLGFYLPSPATWQLWIRMYGPTPQSDGWLESVDSASFDYINPSQHGVWQWVEGRSYALDAGLHTLTLGGNEAGARVDRILITDDPAFIPSEQPGSDVTPPASATGLSATAGDGEVLVEWTNPSDQDVARVVVRYRTDGRAPLNPHDGYPLVDRAAAPGAVESVNHVGLTNGITYHYGVFVFDGAGNTAGPAETQATPEDAPIPPGDVSQLRRTDVLDN